MGSEIEIEIDVGLIRYRINVEDPKKANVAVQNLKLFIKKNDAMLLKAANDAIENRLRTAAKLTNREAIDCRLPHWFKAANPSVPETMALILYFANRPLTMVQITKLTNQELKGPKRDIRNISRHVTSKGWILYGYTVPNRVTQTYELNRAGKKWIEDILVPKLMKQAEKRLKNTDKNQPQ